MVVPATIVPIAIIPVIAGANVTNAPGIAEKLLFGVAELYNCALIVIDEPINDNANVVLKKADNEVIVPSLGIENAKFVKVPAGFVRSINPPTILSPAAEEPNPKKPGVPIRPPAIVVNVSGIPELNAMIAELPVGPVFPVACMQLGKKDYAVNCKIKKSLPLF